MGEVVLMGNHSLAADVSVFPNFPAWQVFVILGVISWMYFTRLTLLTVRLRSVLQPYVAKKVESSVPFLLGVQSICNPTLDLLFSSLSYSVSVEFYTAFLPLLFWAGHSRLARDMTVLMALCLYLGNCLKDVVSAPRPPSPPVRKLLATQSETESAQEYGLPSSHTINSLGLAGFLLYYLRNEVGENDVSTFWLSVAVVGFLVCGVIYSRLYLGMHSPLDVKVGAVMGFGILFTWCSVEKHVDAFISRGENVISFWATMAVLLLFAYPAPEQRNPSYEFHTAFNGVAFGVVSGVHRTFDLFHHEGVEVFSLTSITGVRILLLRLLVGLPVCLAVKAVSKKLAIKLLPSVCNLLGLEIHSSCYVPAFHMQEISLKEKKKTDGDGSETGDGRRPGYLLKIIHSLEDEVLDVDTGIRALQYAGLGWSVVELAPQIFSYLNL